MQRINSKILDTAARVRSLAWQNSTACVYFVSLDRYEQYCFFALLCFVFYASIYQIIKMYPIFRISLQIFNFFKTYRLHVLVPTYRYIYWCSPMGTCTGAYLWVHALVFTYGYMHWCSPMGTCTGAHLWVHALVSTYGYIYWCSPMGTCIGAHLGVHVLLPTYGYMYWCPPRGTCIGAYLWVLGYDCMINLQFGYIITVNGHIFHPITEILNLSQKYF